MHPEQSWSLDFVILRLLKTTYMALIWAWFLAYGLNEIAINWLLATEQSSTVSQINAAINKNVFLYWNTFKKKNAVWFLDLQL